MPETEHLLDEITFNQIQELKLNAICYQLTTRGKFWPFKARFNSTSFFIAKNFLLTSAHNVVSTYRHVNELIIAPSRVGDVYHYGTYSMITDDSTHFRIFPEYDMKNKTTRSLYDIALIYVPDTIIAENPNFTYQNNLPLLEDLSSLTPGEVVYCAGYPASGKHKNRYRMTLDTSEITEIKAHSFTHGLSTATGNSGSPIMVKRNDQFYVIGVNSIKHNGTLINDTKKQWIQESIEGLTQG